MKTPTLAEHLEQNPHIGLVAYDNLEQSLNTVLPGSNYHKRYNDINEVGLATVVARDAVAPGSYSPFDPETPQQLSFMATNRQSRPEAWLPVESDEKMLGGPVPERLGRFGAFAIAKAHILTSASSEKISSHRVDTSKVKPGEFANAGGQRLPGSYLAMSGLWEVHDHIAGQVFNEQIKRASNPDLSDIPVDNLSDLLESILGDIELKHAGEKAENLGRLAVSQLLADVHSQTARRLQALR